MNKTILILFIFSSVYCFAQKQENSALAKKTLVMIVQKSPKKTETTYRINETASKKENTLIKKIIKNIRQTQPDKLKKVTITNAAQSNGNVTVDRKVKNKSISMNRVLNPAKSKPKAILANKKSD